MEGHKYGAETVEEAQNSIFQEICSKTGNILACSRDYYIAGCKTLRACLRKAKTVFAEILCKVSG